MTNVVSERGWLVRNRYRKVFGLKHIRGKARYIAAKQGKLVRWLKSIVECKHLKVFRFCNVNTHVKSGVLNDKLFQGTVFVKGSILKSSLVLFLVGLDQDHPRQVLVHPRMRTGPLKNSSFPT